MTQEPFGDIPLFREIQRLLASNQGPVNLEIARQVAQATATQGRIEPPQDPAAARAFADAVRSSEVVLAGYTRLPLEEPISSDVTSVSGWVTSTLHGWRWIFEHLATRLAGELIRIGDSEDQANPMQAAMGQIGPLLMGLQVGSLVGQLAKQSLGRYDLPIPRDDDGRLTFVTSNADQVARDYGLDIQRFRSWLALHEVSRHLIVRSIPWVHRYFKSLLIEVVDAIEIDVSDLERRFTELGSQGMEALQSGAGVENLLPVVPTERHRRALDRLRAFLALLEGYATHAAAAVAVEVVGDPARIDEGMARRAASISEGEAMLANILGISVDRALETAGATFCAGVTKLKGPQALNLVWEAPDNLPSVEEIRDPFAWIERQSP